MIDNGKGTIAEVYRLSNKSDFGNVVLRATSEHCLADNTNGEMYCVEGSCNCSDCCAGYTADTNSPSTLRVNPKFVKGKQVNARVYIY